MSAGPELLQGSGVKQDKHSERSTKQKEEKQKKQNEQNKNSTKKRTKRKKTMEKKLREITVYYNNIRGMQSKMDSLVDAIEETRPTFFALVETHLEDGEKIDEIEGYTPIRNNRNKLGGGVMIGVRNEIFGSVVQLETLNTESMEQIWIEVGTKTKYKIGVIYLPRGEKANIKEIKETYDAIQQEIWKGKEKGQRILVLGDFNSKTKYAGGPDKGGKELERMVKEMECAIVNEMQVTTGKWTRVEKDKKSVLDYMIVDKKDSASITSLLIDEDHKYTPFHLITEEGFIREKFTDHNAMVCNIRWTLEAREKEEPREIMGKRGMAKFQRIINEEKVSRLLQGKGSLQERYNTWMERIESIIKKCKTKVKKKKEQCSRVRLLMRARQKVKKAKSTKMRRIRKKLLGMHIIEEKQQRFARKIKKTVEELRRNGGGMKEESFWEFKRKLKGKQQETATEMMNEKGELVSGKEEIIDVYKNFYINLFKKEDKTNQSEEQKRAERKVEEKMGNIRKIARTQDPLKVTETEVRKVVNELKRKKAPDLEDFRNEYLKGGGEEMILSLVTLFNQILKELSVPEQWAKVKVKSIYKNKGKRTEMKNRRGIFLTNVVSKAFEKVLLEKVGPGMKITRFQNGGQKKRSTKDNWLALMAVIDRNRKLKQDTYLLCADAEKCFDRLWLEDCLVDIRESGLRERETVLLHEMNKKAQITVATPCGETEEFEVENIVKQGTIFGPLLCCCNTAKITTIGENAMTVVSPEVSIGPLTYVDDITVAGSAPIVEAGGKKLAIMEEEKKYTFNTEKTNYMIIKTGKKSEVKKELEMNVKKGKIERTKRYKVLGNWIDEGADLKEQIQEIDKNSWALINEARRIAKDELLGMLSTEAALLMYERTLAPTILNNLECWTRIGTKEMEEIEKIQGRILKNILKLPVTTPYMGLLKETGIWPAKERIKYQRLMLYQNMITSEEDRLGRVILKDQELRETELNWLNETTRIAREMKIEIERARDNSKEAWKKHIKVKIKEEIEKEMRKKEGMRKMRHQVGQKFERKGYLSKMGIKEASKTIKRRLEMIDVGNNFGKSRKCKTCGEKEDTEHIIDCQNAGTLWNLDKESLKETENVAIVRKANDFVYFQIEKRETECDSSQPVKYQRR